jgi:hypothetical protein
MRDQLSKQDLVEAPLTTIAADAGHDNTKMPDWDARLALTAWQELWQHILSMVAYL